MARMAQVARMIGVACMGITSHLVARRIADMSRNEFTAAVVAAIDNALPDGFNGDPCFVVVNGGAAGHVVHVGVMDAWQRRELPLHTRCAQGRNQVADFDGACFHGGSFEERGAQCACRFVPIRHDGRNRGVRAT